MDIMKENFYLQRKLYAELGYGGRYGKKRGKIILGRSFREIR